MQNKKYFNISDNLITNDISAHLLKMFGRRAPIIICLGTDKVLSDMVGVFVADFLKQQNIKTIVLGGTNQNVNKNMAKLIVKNYIKSSNILFVDSGLLLKNNTILFNDKTILNDGTILNYPSLTCSTISKISNKICLASIRYNNVLTYAKIISQSICDYFSYLSFLNSKHKCN